MLPCYCHARALRRPPIPAHGLGYRLSEGGLSHRPPCAPTRARALAAPLSQGGAPTTHRRRHTVGASPAELTMGARVSGPGPRHCARGHAKPRNGSNWPPLPPAPTSPASD
eukprot:scaffold18791_cov106-Isochrysis_galbana.AAC.4